MLQERAQGIIKLLILLQSKHEGQETTICHAAKYTKLEMPQFRPREATLC